MRRSVSIELMAATLLSYHVTPIRHRVAPIRFSFSRRPLGFPCWTSQQLSSRSFFSPPRALLADSATVFRDAGATAAVMAGAYALVSAFDTLTQSNLIQQPELKQEVSTHTVWIAFHGFLASFQNSTSVEARYFASLIPLANCVRLLINGLSLTTDKGLIKSVTRDGSPDELLRGPLYYVLVLIVCALVFWRDSPVGVISLAMMCGGDGVADIIGRRFGYLKLPYNEHKSWAGSISMFAFGFLVSLAMLYYFSYLGYFTLDWPWTAKRVALISLLAAIVESLPVIDDNISVPVASMILAYMAFGM
ncbi:LOW QUALITY PROTEIN: hypothetical protein V2J09_001436 [Rumex salicifolius]